MIWVAIYVVLVNVGDALSFPPPVIISATGVLLAGLSIVLLLYLKKTDLGSFYGLRRPEAGTMRLALYLVPLFAIAFFQYTKGFVPDTSAQALLSACLLVVGVGFIEELLFRGFLFQALLKKGNLNRAILVSGVTFGIGHIVNLARGYTVVDQLIQIVAAVLIGIALGYCVALTRSIVPGVIFHALFNLSGTLTNHDVVSDMYIMGAIVIVLVPYILFMRNRLAHMPTQQAVVRAKGDSAFVEGNA